MTTLCYTFHGITMGITAPEPVQDALHARLAEFPVTRDKTSTCISFLYEQVRTPKQHIRRPDGNGRRILGPEMGIVEYFDDTQELYLNLMDETCALCNLVTRQVHVSFTGDSPSVYWRLSHPAFTVCAAELFKRQQRYMVHAAAVALDGNGLLMAGVSGSGKTTLTLALARAGFAFLADDTLFLMKNAASRVRVLAFPDELNITAEIASFFPELQQPWERAPKGTRNKRSIRATHVYGAPPCWTCKPTVLLFPQTTRQNRSLVEPLSKDEALLQLVCNVLRTELDSSQAHLDALVALVDECRCYRLRTARDFDELPEMLRNLLNEALRA